MKHDPESRMEVRAAIFYQYGAGSLGYYFMLPLLIND